MTSNRPWVQHLLRLRPAQQRLRQRSNGHGGGRLLAEPPQAFLTLGLRSIAVLEFRESKHLPELNGVESDDLE
jgi:hypothetical protein